jgi:hypothetical protein
MDWEARQTKVSPDGLFMCRMSVNERLLGSRLPLCLVESNYEEL